MGYSITFLIGTLFLIGSLYLFSTSINFIKTGTRTIATVDELHRESGKKGKSTYRPIFRFTTITGKEIHYPYQFASAPPDWQVGEKATIVYNVDEPENPIVLTYFGSFGWAILTLAIAAALLIIGGGYHIFHFYAKQFLL